MSSAHVVVIAILTAVNPEIKSSIPAYPAAKLS